MWYYDWTEGIGYKQPHSYFSKRYKISNIWREPFSSEVSRKGHEPTSQCGEILNMQVTDRGGSLFLEN